jgi:hypothetical protein
VYNGALIAEDQGLEEEVFQGNLYWNLAGESSFFGAGSFQEWARSSGKETHQGEVVGRYLDPMLINANSLEITDPEKITAGALQGFFPQPGSPLIDGGLDLKELFGLDPGDLDIAGNAIPFNQKFDLGAIEYVE